MVLLLMAMVGDGDDGNGGDVVGGVEENGGLGVASSGGDGDGGGGGRCLKKQSPTTDVLRMRKSYFLAVLRKDQKTQSRGRTATRYLDSFPASVPPYEKRKDLKNTEPSQKCHAGS